MSADPAWWHFVVPGEPKGRKESQAIGFVDKATGKVRARNVQPKGGVTKGFEALVASFAMDALRHVGRLDQPLVLDILAVFPRPAYLTEPWQPDGLIVQASKPDRDNIEKAVQDGMRAEWRDDCRVSVGTTIKAYAERTGKPRTEIWLRAVLRDEAFDFHGHKVVMQAGDEARAAYRARKKAEKGREREKGKAKTRDDRDGPELDSKTVEASDSPSTQAAFDQANRLF
jgi:Holliday junction resolvase RusA-like endonuclease